MVCLVLSLGIHRELLALDNVIRSKIYVTPLMGGEGGGGFPLK